jgi:hypothetical protein
MYPSFVSQLVLVNPIGLEDWKAKGVPHQSIDQIYVSERASNYSTIRGYEQSTYYLGTWAPSYDVWVNMLSNIYKGPEAEPFAFDQALITDAVYTQPISHELPLLESTKTLLIIRRRCSSLAVRILQPFERRGLHPMYNASWAVTAPWAKRQYVLWARMPHWWSVPIWGMRHRFRLWRDFMRP